MLYSSYKALTNWVDLKSIVEFDSLTNDGNMFPYLITVRQ